MGFKDYREGMKMLKDLQKKMSSGETLDPYEMLNSMGISMDDINEQFVQQQANTKVTLRYSLKSVNEEPSYAYPTDSGFDIRSNKKVTLGPLERDLVPTGVFINIPEGYEIQVRPKSGLAIKKGLSVVNTPGTVDQGYTGEIQVILINLSNETHTIEVGDKIAQAVLCPVVAGKHINLQRVLNVDDKDRGDNGFGSTGN
jgi:dUTP pyrophosphatase